MEATTALLAYVLIISTGDTLIVGGQYATEVECKETARKWAFETPIEKNQKAACFEREGGDFESGTIYP